MVNHVQEYQFSLSVNNATENVSALAALPLKENYSETEQRK